MASIPETHAASVSSAEEIENRFRQLEATWMAEVGYSSSARVLSEHPAFREIVALGPAVVPLMLCDLAKRPRLWVWALPEITGVDPVPELDRGNIAKMSEAWLRWGRAPGYQC
jgi:hypothetical protein